jgi:hypothetical protein
MVAALTCHGVVRQPPDEDGSLSAIGDFEDGIDTPLHKRKLLFYRSVFLTAYRENFSWLA